MKKILIVGGSGGLGRQVTELLKNKYTIHSVGSSEIDITNLKSCKEFFEKEDYEIVLNFAGINYDSFVHKIDESNMEDIDKMLQVNIYGTINLVSSVLKQMRKKNYGRIILISSILSEKEIIGTSVYSSCKAFIDKFVKNTSLENIKKGITVNSLQLGYFDGGMTYTIPEKNLLTIKESIGLQRFGKIEELVNAIEFLINTEYITGTNIKLNGGL